MTEPLAHFESPAPLELRGATKQRILRAALEEFSRHGFAGSRVDRIAARAGANKALLYYHFASKEKLYRTVVEQFYAETAERLRSTIAGATALEDLLFRLANFYSDTYSRQPEFGPIVLRELADPQSEILEIIAAAIRASGAPELAQNHLREGQERGQIRPVDSRQILAAFISLNIGYLIIAPIINRVLGITDRENFARDRSRAVVDLFLNGIKTR
jgi:TetR/AcrR family transcriptional regulator